MQQRLIECVPNFSEGRDVQVIRRITDEIRQVKGIRMLNVDTGKDANRTVVTFVGEPEAVVEAAFLGIKAASGLIDMRRQTGEHPRLGATDVCPLIPLSGISMEETVVYAKQLAKRVGQELDIPVYLYENASSFPERKQLSAIRSGEYEGLPAKLKDHNWLPDFGPDTFNAKAGATVIGARDFLIAYNVNLDSASEKQAKAIAAGVRESGRVKMENGKKILDDKGDPVRIPGSLKHVKAIGWYMEEYGICQVSLNLTNVKETPLHIAFEECRKKAAELGLQVTGSELVGMIPLQCLVEAGKYFLKQQEQPCDQDEEHLVTAAIKYLGLEALKPFDRYEKIIEYCI